MEIGLFFGAEEEDIEIGADQADDDDESLKRGNPSGDVASKVVEIEDFGEWLGEKSGEEK